MTRWTMVADLERCVGCQTCTAACRHTNATAPAVQWRKVLDVEAGAYPNVSRTFVPVGCQHCADPPCMHVCPSTATRRRADGIVTIDFDICIGCAYCDVACPYQARFKVDAPRLAYGNVAMDYEIEREDPRRLGVAQKCTFCSDRIDFGLANSLTPGLDPRATPACVNACIADALHFGDLDDPDSNVSRLLRTQRHFRMHEELGTEPGFYYLYGAANAAQRDEPAPALPEEPAKLRTRGVAPWHQQHWDWKAAGNFICGGAGAGLFAIAGVSSLALGSSFPLGLVALALVALGLFSVLLKIGRPWRFIYVLRQPQRSWMAREAWVACSFFPIGLAAVWFDAPALAIVGAFIALSYLFSQAMMLRAAKGIPAWRTRLIVPLIVSTGIAEGSGCFLAAAALWFPLRPAVDAAALVAILAAVLRAGIWHAYLSALEREGAPTRSITVLDAFRPWFFAFGLALPLALIAAGFAAAAAASLLFALAGAAIFAAGGALKFILVTRAGYNQGFALTHTPVRGSGIAGPAVKPGWT
jgi:Fe-S-cluster-containing dehydrogenase component/DMSO reductase anchor subunit